MVTENGYSFGNSTLKLAVSEDSLFHLEQTLEASGRNNADARKQINLINTRFKQDENTLVLSDRVEVFKNAKFREQNVAYTLHIPGGKFVKINGGFDLDLDNFEDKFDEENIEEKTFTVANGKLNCLNCDTLEDANDLEEEHEEEIIKIIGKDTVVVKTVSKKENVDIKIGKKQIKIVKNIKEEK